MLRTTKEKLRSPLLGEVPKKSSSTASPTQAPLININIDRISPTLRITAGKFNMVADGLSRTALLAEQAGKPLHYNRARIAEIISPREGAWATADFSSFYAAGINRDNLTGIYGFHTGAVVAMCDASVHLFSEDMEPEVVTALLSRNGDEIINTKDWQ